MSCALAALALQLKIDEATLREWGLSDDTRHYGGCVRIPYTDEHGAEVAIRLQTAVDGYDRFRWQAGGGRPLLYGLSRLPSYSPEHVVLVNGEADCWTLWYDDSTAQAVGLSGANSWDEERDAAHFSRFERIYLAFGAGAARTAMLDWLARSSIRDRAYVIDLPEGYANLAEIYQQDAQDFATRWQHLFINAVSYSELAAEEQQQRRSVARNHAERLLRSKDILAEVYQTAQRDLHVVGEERIVKLVYLCMTSRLLNDPVPLIVKGPSSSGKSYLVEQTLKLFPSSAYVALTSMSRRALIYSREPIKHRTLVIYEAAGMAEPFVALTIRTLISEKRLSYDTPDGTIVREGPTGLIVTTTELSLHPENETRCISVTTDDSPQQTERILAALTHGHGHNASPQSLTAWHAMQDYLALGEQDVEIPYGAALAASRLIALSSMRMRRDFNRVLSLIKAHALLHQQSRERDANGAILANLDDYEVVRELIGDLITEAAGVSMSPIVRQTYEAVAALLSGGAASVTMLQLARALQLDLSTVHRRVNMAIAQGMLRNMETGRSRPARLVLGDDIPDEPILLPNAAALKAAIGRSGSGHG